MLQQKSGKFAHEFAHELSINCPRIAHEIYHVSRGLLIKEIAEILGAFQTIEGDVLTITKPETANKARDDYKIVNGNAVKMTADKFDIKPRVEFYEEKMYQLLTKISYGSIINQNMVAEYICVKKCFT